MITNKRDHVLVSNTHVPPGLVEKEDQHGMQFGLVNSMGKHGTSQPNKNTTVRPNIKTTYFYNELGEVTGIDQVAVMWLVSGDWSDETWADLDELKTQVTWVLLDYFGLPDNQFNAMYNTIDCVVLTHEGMLLELVNNPEEWGEVVG